MNPEELPNGRSRRSFDPSLWNWLIILAAAAALFLMWQAVHALLLLFAGILLAVLLDSGVRVLQRVLPVGRLWALALICLLLVGLTVAAIAVGGYHLVTQADQLFRTVSEQVEGWRSELEAVGVDSESGSGDEESDGQPLSSVLLPNPEDLLERAGTAFTTTFGVIGDVILIIFVGIFAAASPLLYRRGVQSLFPHERRARLGAVLDEAGHALRWWLVGQIVAMILIGVTTWFALMLIGMPSPVLLGVQAGLFNFVPYIGPLIGAIPILLVALAHDGMMVAWAMGTYLVIQTVEGHFLTPIIQRQAVHVPPLLTLAALLVFGALFGLVGIALATPLIAVVRILVLRLYVEDILGDKTSDKEAVAT